MTIALCFEKIVSPKNDGHEVIGSNKFSFSRTSGAVELLFSGRADRHGFTKRHPSTCVTTHVRMCSMRSVCPPFGDGNTISA
jgi:hypothetical protein